MNKQKASPTGRARTPKKTMHSPYASLIWCFVDTNLETSLAFPVHSNAPHRQVCDELLRLHPIIFPKYGKVTLLSHISMIQPVSSNTPNATTRKYQYSLDSPGSFGQMMSAPKCWLYVDLKPHAIGLPASIEKEKKSLDNNNSNKEVQIVDRQQPSSTKGKEKKEKKKRRLEEAKSPPSNEGAPGSAAAAAAAAATATGEGDGQPKSKKRRLEKAPSKEIPPPPAAATHVAEAVVAPPPAKATAAATIPPPPSAVAAKDVEHQSPGNGKKKRGKRTRGGVDKHPETETDQPAPVGKEVVVVVVNQTEQPQSAPATEVIQGSPVVVVGKQQQQHEGGEDKSTPATLNLNDIKKKEKKERKKREKREKAAIAAAALKKRQPPVPAVVPPPPPPPPSAAAAAEAVQEQKLSHVEAKKVDQKRAAQAQKKSSRNEERPVPIAPRVVVAVAEPQQDNTQGNLQPSTAVKVDVEEEKKKKKKNALPVPVAVPVPAKKPANSHVAKESSPSQSSDEEDDDDSDESESSGTTTTTASGSSSSDDDDDAPTQSALPPSGSIPFNELLLKASLQMKNKNKPTNDKDPAHQESTQKQPTAAAPSTGGETAVTNTNNNNNHNNNKKNDKPTASAPELKFQWQKPYTSFTSKNVKTLLRSMIKEALEDEHKTKEGSQSAKLPKDYWVKMAKPDWWPLEGFNTDCFKKAEHCAKLYETLRVILGNMHGVELVANPKL